MRDEWIHFAADRAPTPDATPRRTLGFLLAGLGLTALVFLLGLRAEPTEERGGPGGRQDERRGERQEEDRSERQEKSRPRWEERPGARRGLAAVAVVWCGVFGVLGSLAVFLWAFTDHVYSHGNHNLFYANPLLLALAVVVPSLAAGRSWAVRWAPRLAVAVAGLSLAGILVEALPGTGQVNGEFVALLVPVNLALAWSLRRQARTPRTPASAARSAPGAGTR